MRRRRRGVVRGVLIGGDEDGDGDGDDGPERVCKIR